MAARQVLAMSVREKIRKAASMNIKAELLSVLAALDATGIPYAICGGLCWPCMGIRGLPRTSTC